ncbi:hypothetical protein Y032_0040g295 [Ancylostoma ceylanicum]|uniref:Uncharacterized protein n=1 Tax=Ancylostoma ceylanicum TaxID=53326 RepID=A0A016UGX9_9BILA|nr:hypothetical protein Y032_0040g295 [Ancylostoma ceylanicum]
MWDQNCIRIRYFTPQWPAEKTLNSFVHEFRCSRAICVASLPQKCPDLELKGDWNESKFIVRKGRDCRQTPSVQNYQNLGRENSRGCCL